MIGQVLVHVETSLLGLKRFVCSWTADSTGVAEIDFDGHSALLIEGDPVRLVTVPSLSSPPTANYDIKLFTRNDFDILSDAGDDRSASEIETAGVRNILAGDVRFAPNQALARLRLLIKNAGSGGSGVVVLQVLPQCL